VSVFLSTVVAGLAIGSIYGLVGIGYTVSYNATRVFNLAQGDLVMVGIMASFYGLDVLKLPQIVDFILVVLFVALIAGVEERTVVRPFLKKTGAASFGWFIATLGVSAIIETIVNVLFGTHDIVSIPSPLPLSGLHVGSSVIGYQQLLVIGTFVAIIVLLDAFYARTWMGQAMLAAAEDREAASLVGINPAVMSRTAFIMAGVLAGVAGFVIAPITFSNPALGLSFTLKGFLALAIGGFGSIRGAVVGGLTLGVAEQLFDTYVSSNYEIVVGAGLVLLVLSVRPEGLFRTNAARTV
jgi:branched-subunit amino acid ABC-type transport system permease component